MLPTLSIENQIREVMERIHLTSTVLGQLAQLCNLTGFSQARISQAFAGVKRFEDHKAQRLLSLVREVEELCVVADFPLNLSNPEQIKQWLDERRGVKAAAKYDRDDVAAIIGAK